jgi:endonuclease V-like protein UPF0215 family
VKPGTRALGVAESYAGTGGDSTLCGAVVRADRVVDGVAFGTCTVGGTDATDAVRALAGRLDRPDVRYVLVAGVAPAWFNVLDVRALAESLDRPVVSVSFEASPGLASAIEREFDGAARADRLETYRRQPDRLERRVGGERLFVRAAGVDAERAGDVVAAFTPEGGRPEPLRVARLCARAGRAYRERTAAGSDPDDRPNRDGTRREADPDGEGES